MPGLQYRSADAPGSPGGHGPRAVAAYPGPRRQPQAAPVVLSVLARDPGSRFAVLSAALFLASAVCGRVDLSPGTAVAVVLVALGAGCLTLPPRWAVAAGASAWALVTGFVVNTAGQLTTDADDLRRAGACLAVATVTSLVGSRRGAAVDHPGRVRGRP